MIRRLLSRKCGMRLIPLIIFILAPGLAMAQEGSIAYFTDAAIPNCTKTAKPADALPDAPGSVGNGVLLTKSVGIDNPVIQQYKGMLAFWIKPNWDGNDGQLHKLVRMGDPTVNGMIVEKSPEGYIRYVMTAGGKTTASRTSVANWKAGEWHHIEVAWMDCSNRAIGLPLWVDKVCVDGPIWGGIAFMNPTTMTDKKIYIGDATSDAVMDELIVRKDLAGTDRGGQTDAVYRDYFQTAPYSTIKINPDANFIPSDKRVVINCQKQFGLDALINGKYEHVTDFAQRYGNWSDFDAKPYISWSTSNSTIATVDSKGMVSGKALGTCTLTASFHGVTDTYNIEVISTDKPDLDLKYVERLPRYSYNQMKKWPDAGEIVQTVAHIENFGYADAPAGTVVKFELVPDANDNFRDDDTPTDVRTFVIDHPIAPRSEETVEFDWPWTQDKVFIRVTVDPDNAIDEICEANNLRSGLNVGRAVRWGINTNDRDTYYNNKQINGIGSFSDYDWKTAHSDRVNVMLKETVLPTSSPDGVRDAVRVDNFIVVNSLDNLDYQEYGQVAEYYDGGFPWTESGIMWIDAAVCHELGHCMLGLPDLYGYPFWCKNMLLKDNSGIGYSGTKLFPIVDASGNSMFSWAEGCTPCGAGYSTLMCFCHMWLEPQSAGLIQHFAQDRGHPFWSIHGYLIPQNDHVLHVYDVNDEPLKGAAVYIYPLVETPGNNNISSAFIDRAKFIGTTDDNGVYHIGQTTDIGYDDPDTDEVEGAVYSWNPFHHAYGDVAWTPYCFGSDGMLLIKIVSGTQTEFRMMALTELNEAFFRGETSVGNYTVKTSLTSVPGGTAIYRPTIPDIIKTTNKKPIAIAPKFIFATKGKSFSIDGSQSYDPEGQTLTYRWRGTDTYDPIASLTSSMSATFPMDKDELTYQLWVIDGTRVSYGANVKVTSSPFTIRGQVTYPNGSAAIGAIVGLKDGNSPASDALIYTTSDNHGFYQMNVPSGSYCIAAWKPGYMPGYDSWVYISDGSISKDLQLPSAVGNNYALNQWVWASNSGATTPASLANDGSTTTGWATVTNPPSRDQSFIVDVSKNGQKRNVAAMIIYWYGNSRPSSYYIDVLVQGNPQDPASWDNPYNYATVYSAQGSAGGWKDTTTGCYINPIRLWEQQAYAIRVRFASYAGIAQYGIKEIGIYPKATVETLSELKNKPVGTQFLTGNKIITTSSGGALPTKVYYVEEPDRSSGFRLNTTTAASFDAGIGDCVDLTGSLQADAVTGEKYIAATQIERKSGVRPINAVGMTNRDASRSITLGLYVKVWGKVDSVGDSSFVINDGSGTPLTVCCGDLGKPEEGDFVRVRGVISTDGTNNIVLIRNQFDWMPGTSEFQPLPIPGTQGSPREALILGPFIGSGLLDTDLISLASGGTITEATVRPSIGDTIGDKTWIRAESLGEFIDFGQFMGYGQRSEVAYAHIYIYSPVAQTVDIPLAAADSATVWLNGTQIYRNDSINTSYQGVVCATNVALQQGLNSMLFKVGHTYYSWGVEPQFAVPGSWTGPGYGGSIPMTGLGYVLSNHMGQ